MPIPCGSASWPPKGLPSRQMALLNVLGSKRKGLEQSQRLSPWIFPS